MNIAPTNSRITGRSRERAFPDVVTGRLKTMTERMVERIMDRIAKGFKRLLDWKPEHRVVESTVQTVCLE